jgi:hypothetical protein
MAVKSGHHLIGHRQDFEEKKLLKLKRFTVSVCMDLMIETILHILLL